MSKNECGFLAPVKRKDEDITPSSLPAQTGFVTVPESVLVMLLMVVVVLSFTVWVLASRA